MNPIERALGILLLLTGGKTVPATALAERFAVSVRTVYRDVDRLMMLGVPVEATRGAQGGFRLTPGYLQPPVALTRDETAALLVAMALARGIAATPLAPALDTAEKKLLTSLPPAARALLEDGGRLIGVEPPPPDIFHVERPVDTPTDVRGVVDGFLQALLTEKRVRFTHRTPYRGRPERVFEAEPRAILWDRDRWYLAGRLTWASDGSADREDRPLRLWRAHRIVALEVTGFGFRDDRSVDIRDLLGRGWLDDAMRRWEAEGPTAAIRLTAAQADLLGRDWYYRHGRYEDRPDGSVMLRLPTESAEELLPLMRWLGPGAELIEPADLRRRLADELAAMAAAHRGDGSAPDPGV
jgi:predicted DNA-binding transcriptional regulator YafY